MATGGQQQGGQQQSGQPMAPANNQAERIAKGEHLAEQAVTGKDPIPRTTPSWAKDVPKGGRK